MGKNRITSDIINNSPPKNRAMAGPTEKSRLYAKSNPPNEAKMAVTQIIAICRTKREVNIADIVAGIIKYANTTTTPAIWTDSVITMPSNCLLYTSDAADE